MRLCCGAMNGYIWEAAVQAAAGEQAGAAPTVVLSNEEVLSPADAEFGEFTIVEATEGEREALRRSGYAMPDWDPAEWSGCPTCHVEQAAGNEPMGGEAEV